MEADFCVGVVLGPIVQIATYANMLRKDIA
jgi:hypothetical protein